MLEKIGKEVKNIPYRNQNLNWGPKKKSKGHYIRNNVDKSDSFAGGVEKMELYS